jgi:hypothetical protein
MKIILREEEKYESRALEYKAEEKDFTAKNLIE